MPIVLFRVDERLLHGQVLVGWGARLALRYYLVVDDPLAASDWEQELYAAGVPDGLEVTFLGTEEAVRRLEEFDARPEAGALLTRGTRAMRALAEAGLLKGRRVNVGGIHAAPSRRRALDYVYLGADEVADLRAIGEGARSVAARDLPLSPKVPLVELLDAVGHP